MGLILVNSIMLGMKNYTDKEDTTAINKFIKHSDPYFNLMVYLEFVFKVMGMGFIGANSYMTDSWNWLDLFVVVSSFLNDIMPLIIGNSHGGSGLKVMRTVRLLRPLKLLRNIPSIKILITTLLSSVSSLGGIMGLAFFIFLIFAILGVTLWNGKIHYRCHLTERPIDGEWELYPDLTSLCRKDD
jgi:voltage-dependent calcium channel L type alpha-1D